MLQGNYTCPLSRAGGPITKSRLQSWLLIWLLVLSYQATTPLLGAASPEETYGIVSNVIDGDTIDVMIEKADPRIYATVERVRLADVDSPEMSTPEGSPAKDFTYAVLLGKRVFLDIDDSEGRDPYNRLVCVAYLSGESGQPVDSPCFNRMLVDSGHAMLDDYANNEFNPNDWWTKARTDTIMGQLEVLFREQIDRLREGLARELERAGKDAIDKIRGP
jgi:endonuclease YncB( thermonuclease family)